MLLSSSNCLGPAMNLAGPFYPYVTSFSNN